jgi:hypothetical protein
MKSPALPSVLLSNIEGNSISMERALKQIKDILLDALPDPIDQGYDRINASIEDVEMMLQAIDRNGD